MPVRATAGARAHRLTAGRLALIPPGCLHQFTYPAGFCEWLTFRFAVAGELAEPDLIVVGENEVEAALLRALAGVAAPENRRQSEPILSALLGGAYPAASTEAPHREPELVRRLKDEIARRADRRLTVAEAAAAIHRSPSRAAAVFRQATGGSLKNFIDQARCAAALHLLTHSDLPIAQIAAQLEFPDLYSFSRFVKQHSGRAPRAWRRAESAVAGPDQ